MFQEHKNRQRKMSGPYRSKLEITKAVKVGFHMLSFTLIHLLSALCPDQRFRDAVYNKCPVQT